MFMMIVRAILIMFLTASVSYVTLRLIMLVFAIFYVSLMFIMLVFAMLV